MPLDMDKKHLYEGVKALVNEQEHNHLQLSQQKLFTLFSIAFQYFLYKSTKNPGAYVCFIGKIIKPLMHDEPGQGTCNNKSDQQIQ